MKKLLSVFLLAFVLILTACGGDSIYDKEEPQEKKEDEVKKEPVKEVHPALGKVDLTEDAKIMFADFTVEIEKAKITEEKDSYILDLELLYTNDSFPEEKAFMAAVPSFEVFQNDEKLTETTGIMADPKSNYYYKNAPGIWAPIEFKYELINLEDDITINLNPMSEHEEAQAYTINLN